MIRIPAYLTFFVPWCPTSTGLFMLRLRFVLSLLLFPFAALSAQTDSARSHSISALQNRLQVNLTSDDSFTGTFLRLRGDSIWIRDDGPNGELVFDLHRVRKLESFAGTRRVGWVGLVYGTLIGIGVGGAIGAISYTPCTCLFAPKSQGQAAELGAALGAFVGIPIGGIVGLVAKRDRWTAISTTDLPRVSLAPTAHGLSLSASLRF